MSETYKVVGPVKVDDVEPGGTVTLDPDRVNVPALIAAGHIEPVRPPKESATPAKAKKSQGVQDDGVQHDGRDDPR